MFNWISLHKEEFWIFEIFTFYNNTLIDTQDFC